jgi:1,4-dihydroxy-2-naphthoate octaprenyltransferase
VQSGLITRQAMRRAIALVVLLAMICGLAMVWLAFGAEGLLLLLVFVLLGAAAIWAAIAYTASSRPYGYAGLGDLFVFLFFGLVAVGGTYFLQAQHLAAAVLLPAASVGLYSVAVLNVNNIRDLESDREAGKRSLPVRLGPHAARLYHWALLGGGTLLALLYVIVEYHSLWQFLFFVALPLLVRNGLAVWRGHTAEELDPLLRQMSLTTLVFVLAFGLGQLLA